MKRSPTTILNKAIGKRGRGDLVNVWKLKLATPTEDFRVKVRNDP